MFVVLFPLPPFPHCILPWTETKQESFTCCDIRVVLLACPLFSVKVKLVFSGMYSAEVFYCHIEDCSGKKKRYKNIKKTPQKPQMKKQQWHLKENWANQETGESWCFKLLLFSIHFLSSLFIFPPSPPLLFVSFLLSFFILACLQLRLLLWWRLTWLGANLPAHLPLAMQLHQARAQHILDISAGRNATSVLLLMAGLDATSLCVKTSEGFLGCCQCVLLSNSIRSSGQEVIWHLLCV